MKLEEAQAVLDRAWAINRLVANRILEVAPAQALILAYLETNQPAGRLKHWGTNPSYNTDVLCREGYVKKIQEDGDARRTIVHLTPKGNELAGRIRKVIEEAVL